MKTSKRCIKVTVLLCLLVIGLFVLAGCKKKSEPAEPMQTEGITSAVPAVRSSSKKSRKNIYRSCRNSMNQISR